VRRLLADAVPEARTPPPPAAPAAAGLDELSELMTRPRAEVRRKVLELLATD
jgi:hypothetical protein